MNTKLAEKLSEHTKLIKRYARVAMIKIMKPAKYSLDDLIQEGVLAFLYAEKEFVEGRGAAFHTYLTTCLRNHFSNIVKQTYRYKEVNSLSLWDGFQSDKLSQETNLQNKRSAATDTLEILQVSFVIESLSDDELEYVSTMLSLAHKPKGKRRKHARENLGISYEREMELRRSIHDKIRK